MLGHMELQQALAAARTNHQAVLVTIKRDGRPQLSNVLQAVGEDDVIRISITADRAKYHNLRRTPWAALHVNGPTFWSYTVLECDAAVSEIAADPGDDVVEELVALYRAVSGEHEDWDDYRATMVRDRRVVVRLTARYAYPG
jgi:PPOX class probable F420-dependent enzyme